MSCLTLTDHNSQAIQFFIHSPRGCDKIEDIISSIVTTQHGGRSLPILRSCGRRPLGHSFFTAVRYHYSFSFVDPGPARTSRGKILAVIICAVCRPSISCKPDLTFLCHNVQVNFRSCVVQIQHSSIGIYILHVGISSYNPVPITEHTKSPTHKTPTVFKETRHSRLTD
jgi:hypothetical protein